jgi:hypothetical protein
VSNSIRHKVIYLGLFALSISVKNVHISHCTVAKKFYEEESDQVQKMIFLLALELSDNLFADGIISVRGNGRSWRADGGDYSLLCDLA